MKSETSSGLSAATITRRILLILFKVIIVTLTIFGFMLVAFAMTIGADLNAAIEYILASALMAVPAIIGYELVGCAVRRWLPMMDDGTECGGEK